MKVIPNLGSLFKIVHIFRRYNFADRVLVDLRAEGDYEKERAFIGKNIYKWSSDLFKAFNAEVEVRGAENIPEEDGIVFISNHQSYADVPALMIAFGERQLGFIAKEEFQKIPYLGKWITNVRGIYIKRGDPRESLRSINDGAKLIQQGFNVAIYPEGTRSRGPVMQEFKPGAFKLATKAKAKVVPVVTEGGYHTYEDNGIMKSGKVIVEFLPPVDTAQLDRKALVALEKQIEEQIRTRLAEIQAELGVEA